MAAITSIVVTQPTAPDRYSININGLGVLDFNGVTVRQLQQAVNKAAAGQTQLSTDAGATVTVPAGFGS